jgi:lipoprotein NlpI
MVDRHSLGNLHNVVGIYFQRKEEYQTALKHFASSIKLQDAHEKAYYNRGMVYLKMNALKTAVEEVSLHGKRNDNQYRYFLTMLYCLHIFLCTNLVQGCSEIESRVCRGSQQPRNGAI